MSEVSTRAPLGVGADTRRPEGGRGGWSLVFLCALYLLTTGRWGSYVSLPGAPVYAGDVLVLAATVQVALRWRSGGWRPSGVAAQLQQAPVALLVALTLCAWACLRLLISAVTGLGAPLTVARDFAPYAYAGVALLAFLAPAAPSRSTQLRVVYSALSLHVLWVLSSRWLVSGVGITLGGAPVFTTRPDFDSAVCGCAAALALHHLLSSRAARRPAAGAALLAFALGNLYAVGQMQTRAGLLSAGAVSGSVLLARARSRRSASRTLVGVRGLGVVGLVLAGLGLVLLSPAGDRVTEGLSAGSTAAGTIEVRRATWDNVVSYTEADPARTAIGVGFGPDFIEDSGSAYALEGTVYTDVRSPHNYLVGTLARLGVAGLLLAGLLLLTGVALAIRTLARGAGAVDVVAALVLVALPVTAMLGVVLESPFGAIPYFWAIGQLSARRSATLD